MTEQWQCLCQHRDDRSANTYSHSDSDIQPDPCSGRSLHNNFHYFNTKYYSNQVPFPKIPQVSSLNSSPLSNQQIVVKVFVCDTVWSYTGVTAGRGRVSAVDIKSSLFEFAQLITSAAFDGPLNFNTQLLHGVDH